MHNAHRGVFITIEGIEGVGKTTALNFLYEFLKTKNIACIKTREPGGTLIAEEIRKIFLHHHEEPMCANTELLLLFAGRAQHVSQVIKPALENGQWVVCDRFTDASFAYQGGGRGIPFSHIAALAEWVLGGFVPNMTLLLDAPVTVSVERLNQRAKKDRIEKEDIVFFNRIRDAYLTLAASYPKRYRVIRADLSLQAVQQQIITAFNELFCSTAIAPKF